MKSYDIMVIGTGGGMKIALPAADMGRKVVIIEEGPTGGTCLNRGCIPSKMMVYPADLIHTFQQAPHVNLRSPGALTVSFEKLVSRISATVGSMSQNLMQLLAGHPNITLLTGRAVFEKDRVVRVNGETYSADTIFIVTGSHPRIPEIDGLRETPFMTSREALGNTKLPQSMLILGGGYIACELGHVYGTFGTETAFLLRSEFMRKEDREIRQEFASVFSKTHKVHQRVKPVRVRYRDNRFLVEIADMDSGEPDQLQAEALLISTGVTPTTADLGLERTGIKTDNRGFILVDDHLRTDVPGVYAFGDCVGNYFFRHSVNLEGEYLVRSVLEKKGVGPLDYGSVPRAVFTYPEIAAVGRTEDDLQRSGTEYVCGKATYADSNVGLARQLDHGFTKLLIERQTGKLLGGHIVGEEASNTIHILIAMMSMGAGLAELLSMIYIHPALPEIVKDAARDARAKLEAI